MTAGITANVQGLTSNVGAKVESGNTTWRSPKRSSTRTSMDRLLSSAVEVVFPGNLSFEKRSDPCPATMC